MRKEERKYDEKSFTYIILTAVICFVIIVAAISFISYIKLSVHKERAMSLEAQMETTAGLISQSISKYSEYADVCARTVTLELNDGDDLHEFIDSINKKLYLDGARLIIIDKNCTWYAENGSNGRITDLSAYTASTPKKTVYITKGVDVDIESFVYRVRLDAPIDVMTNNGVTTIEYIAVVYYMTLLHTQVSVAFPYHGNEFIVDGDGIMLYKKFHYGVLVRGTNIFTKYAQVDFMYDDSCKDQMKLIENGKIAIAEFKLDGTSYFICTAPLGINDWLVTYVIKSSALSAGAYITTVTAYILIFCAVLTAAVVFAFFFLAKMYSGRRQLAVEQQANLYLEQASRAKSEFLSNMSHDIRTPINGIIGMAMLAEKEDNPPKTRECLKNIDIASGHLLSLVNEVLDMSSIESGKAKLSYRHADLNDISEACRELAMAQIGTRKLTLNCDFSGITKRDVLADELKLKQILLNLLSNAVKYTRDGGTISFTVRTLFSNSITETVRFEVADTGIGMKSEFLSQIWEPFSQEDGGSRTKFKGTGLGMSITKNYVELMGGTIGVASEYEKGSTFTADIPFDLAPQTEERTENQTADSINGVKLMIVEDNEINLLIAHELLESEGAIITDAHNGREALDTFISSPQGTFDAILMDIKMPIMDGIEATEQIRASDKPDAKTIPIIAMTANAFESDAETAKNAGMNAHLTKPINLAEVIHTISVLTSEKGE